jgi:hypothetical protein
VFDVTSPEGHTYQINGPEGSTQADAVRQVQMQLQQSQRPAQAKQPVLSKQQQIEKEARSNVDAIRRKTRTGIGFYDSANEALDSALDGAGSSLFDAPNHLSAAAQGLRHAITGKGKDYSNALALNRAEDKIRREDHGFANALGNVLGFVGGGVGKAGATGTAKLASLAAGEAALASKLGLGMVKGQTARNVAKLAAAGAVSGGVHSAATGDDIATGALLGGGLAGAAPLVGAGYRGAKNQLVGRLGKGAVAQEVKLADIIKQNPDEIEAALAKAPKNSPLASVLEENSALKVREQVSGYGPEVNKVAQDFAKQNLDGLSDRMLEHINRAGKSGRASFTNLAGMKQAQRQAFEDVVGPKKGFEISMDDLELDDLDAKAVREIAARTKSIAPKLSGESGKTTSSIDPTLSEGDSIGLPDSGVFAPGETVSVSDLDSLRRSLNKASRSSEMSNYANSQTYRNAADTIQRHITKAVPEYKIAIDKYAGDARAIEGFKQSAAGKRVADVENNAMRANLMTKEGLSGQRSGTLSRLREGVAGNTSKALKLTKDLMDGTDETRLASKVKGALGEGRVTEQFGKLPTSRLAASAKNEYDQVERLLKAAGTEVKKSGPDSLNDPAYLIRAATILSSGGASVFKASVVVQGLKRIGMREDTASNLAKMLFDPKQSKKALGILKDKAKMSEDRIASMLRNSIVASSLQSTANKPEQ